jgi:CheY-like chemotaxis protein
MIGAFSIIEDRDDLDSDIEELSRDGLVATERARALTQQLLTFSGGGAPLLRAASIVEVVRESASFVMRGSDLICDYDLPDDLWPVRMDPDQISQVLANLLINAKQASHSGDRIDIRAQNRWLPADDKPRRQVVEIAIRDQGAGIRTDQLAKIFDPYFSTKGDGRGLGLATAYSIMKQHDGELEVDSIAGQGSTFRLLIPATDEAPLEPKATACLPTKSGHSILIMDDDEQVRGMLKLMLECLGHHSASAACGSSAISAYSEAMQAGMPFDAVLMDLTVRGGAGGKETISRLLALDPEARAIVISGYSNDPVMAEFPEHGFRARLSKPVSLDSLRMTLNEVITS